MFIKLVKKSEGFYWNIDFILVLTICSKYHNNMLNIIEIYIHKRKYIHGENDFSWSFMNKSRWNTLDFILICNLSGIILQWRCWNSAKFHFFTEYWGNLGTTSALQFFARWRPRDTLGTPFADTNTCHQNLCWQSTKCSIL